MSDHFNLPVNNKPGMHLWWMTAALIAINVGLFSWQVLHGVDITQPSTSDAIRWGADYAPLTFLGEPIRLFTSMFFHFGLVHLMLNMWALYIFGNIAEQLFGRFYFIGMYVLAGLMGSLLSGYITIQNSYEILHLGKKASADLFPSVSAGASGAVMGLGASLTILSVLPPLLNQRYILDKKTLLFIMGLNLAMGFMTDGINNSAHIGGMIMGALLACCWYFGQKFNKINFYSVSGLIVGLIICISFYQYCMFLLSDLRPHWIPLIMDVLP